MRKRPQITTSAAIEPIYISEKRLPCGGALTLGSWNNRLVVADWIDGWHHSTIMNRLQKYTKASVVKSTSKVIEAASDWLDAYFEGSKEAPDFDLLFLGTDFQKRVLAALAGNSIRRDDHLRGARSKSRNSKSRSSSRGCRRRKSFLHHRSLPPRHRQR